MLSAHHLRDSVASLLVGLGHALLKSPRFPSALDLYRLPEPVETGKCREVQGNEGKGKTSKGK